MKKIINDKSHVNPYWQVLYNIEWLMLNYFFN